VAHILSYSRGSQTSKITEAKMRIRVSETTILFLFVIKLLNDIIESSKSNFLKIRNFFQCII